MVLSERDNFNPQGHTIGEQERLAFVALTNYLRIQDHFAYNDQVFYLWDNRRHQCIQIMKCLDKFYCFPSGLPIAVSHVRKYKIHGNSTIFDHLPVELVLEFQPLKKEGPGIRLTIFTLLTKKSLPP